YVIILCVRDEGGFTPDGLSEIARDDGVRAASDGGSLDQKVRCSWGRTPSQCHEGITDRSGNIRGRGRDCVRRIGDDFNAIDGGVINSRDELDSDCAATVAHGIELLDIRFEIRASGGVDVK